jgi:uncharacterized protein (DUF2132 family)
MRLEITDLTEFGRLQLEDDYAATQRRAGGKTSRADFALGWMAMAVRHRLWSYFSARARHRLEEPALTP